MDELRIILPQETGGILVAVSGGADSVALLALLREAAKAQSIRLTAAHFEHGIRAEASLADAAFVRDLCAGWNVPLVEGRADVPALARERSVGLEQAARDARYAFLRKTREEIGADYIALAHHRDDQAETVLMHLLRGSGLQGIAGMKELDGVLYRPLLKFPKATLVAYLQRAGIPWREDETNGIADNPRNGLRLQIIPQMERFYPGAKQAILRFSEIAAAENRFIQMETGRFLSENAVGLPFGWLILLKMPGEGWEEQQVLVMRALHQLTGLSYDSVSRAAELWTGGGRAAELGNGWRAECGRRGLYLMKGQWAGLAGHPLPERGEISLAGGLGRLNVSLGEGRPVRENPFCQELDADAVTGAVVRTWRNGDTIHPLGAPGRQKLSDYFINRHIDRPLRKLIPLLAKGNDVLWVTGEGISEKAKLAPGSRAVRLELTDWPLQKFGGKNDA